MLGILCNAGTKITDAGWAWPGARGKPMRLALALGRLAYMCAVSYCASGAVDINGAALAHKWCLRIKALWSVQRSDALKSVKRTLMRECRNAHGALNVGVRMKHARIRCALKKRKSGDGAGCARKCDER